jgi:pyruvate/2-oxoglutarate dehydrogenase complex dihydrolipoamide dehydrogenase (E3) component
MRFDIVIIGSGPAGLAAAEAAHAAGAKSIAVVESAKRLGGECPNWGCMPTKSLLSSVEALMTARRGKEYGLSVPKVGVDFGSLMRREWKIVDTLTGSSRIEKMIAGLGAELIVGHARFVSPDEIEIGGKRHAAKAFIIAAGSEPNVPSIGGLKEAGYLGVADALSLPRAPKSLAIIGGGPVGIEFAQIFAPLGTKVTVIEAADHILPREDDEIAAVVADSFHQQKIGLFTGHHVLSVTKDGGHKKLVIEPVSGGRQRSFSVEAVFVSVGKRPALHNLGLEKAGIQVDESGRPVLNDYLQTTNPKVYAAGDAAGRMMYTSVAHREGAAAGVNAVKGNSVKVDLSIMPRGTFCHPEVGSVGLTEKEARAKGFDVGIGLARYASLSKSLATGEQAGLVKIVVDKKTGAILGGHIVGQSATELVHEIALAMYASLTYNDLANMIHAFPTFAEGIGAAAGDVH